MASSDRDYLTTLPPELLTKVIAEIPLSSFLALTQTSSGLRAFIKSNAARICNTAIRSRFPLEADFLDVTLQNGWLVATHPDIMGMRQEFEARRTRKPQVIYQTDRTGTLRGRDLPTPELSYKLDKAGPILLSFLEAELLDITEFKGRLWASIMVEDFGHVMAHYNKLLLQLYNGKELRLVEELRDINLVWYYGIQKPKGKINWTRALRSEKKPMRRTIKMIKGTKAQKGYLV